MRNKSRLAGLFVALFVALSALAFTSTAAQATNQEQAEVCYEEVTIYGDVINKETRERTREEYADTWQNFSPNKDQGRFEGPPSWPTDERGTWNHQNKQIPGGHQGPDGVYQRGQGNGSWFYRADGGYSDWTPWSEWTDWPGAGPVNDDGRDRGPAAHGKQTETYQREYRYVVVGEFVKGTEMVEVECPPPPTMLPPETTQPPVTTQPPTTEPPVTTEQPVVTTTPPQPETTVVVATDIPPVPPTVPPAGLPATGTNNGLLALIAAGMLALGGLLIAATRRQQVN